MVIKYSGDTEQTQDQTNQDDQDDQEQQSADDQSQDDQQDQNDDDQGQDDQTDSQELDDQGGDQGGQQQQQQQPNPLDQAIQALVNKVDSLEYEIKQMKQDNIGKVRLLEPDLNNTVVSSKPFKYRVAFLQVIDELDVVAESIAKTNPRLAVKIDTISDRIKYFGEKGGVL